MKAHKLHIRELQNTIHVHNTKNEILLNYSHDIKKNTFTKQIKWVKMTNGYLGSAN